MMFVLTGLVSVSIKASYSQNVKVRQDANQENSTKTDKSREQYKDANQEARCKDGDISPIL
jgi:hypothetical protein